MGATVHPSVHFHLKMSRLPEDGGKQPISEVIAALLILSWSLTMQSLVVVFN